MEISKYIIRKLLPRYHEALAEVLRDLEVEQDELAREDLIAERNGFSTAIRHLKSITDISSARAAQEGLLDALEGVHPASMVLPINNAIRDIEEYVLVADTPRRTDDPVAEAIRVIRSHLRDEVKARLAAEMSANPNGWSDDLHFDLGMAVRNLLRRAGLTEEVFGIENLDEIWKSLLLTAVLGDTEMSG